MPFSPAFVDTLLHAQNCWDNRLYNEPKSLLLQGDNHATALENRLRRFGRFDVDVVQAIGLLRDDTGNPFFHESFLNKLQRSAFPGSLVMEQTSEGLCLQAAYFELLACVAVLQLQEDEFSPLINDQLINL